MRKLKYLNGDSSSLKAFVEATRLQSRKKIAEIFVLRKVPNLQPLPQKKILFPPLIPLFFLSYKWLKAEETVLLEQKMFKAQCVVFLFPFSLCLFYL